MDELMQFLQEIEDESFPTQNYNIETQGIPRFNNAVQFDDVIEKFTIEYSNNEWKRRNPHQVFSEITQKDILLNSTTYQYIQNNPMRNISEPLIRGMNALHDSDFVTAVLYFDETIRQGLGSLTLWGIFSNALLRINQFDRVIGAVKQVLHLRPDHLSRHSLLCKIYIIYKCKYQVCQSAFNWLKNNELYRHLIPFDFTMDNKNSSELDKNQFNRVEDLFLRAVQLNHDPDLLNMLTRLYYGYGDFDKVIGCVCTKIISSNTISATDIRTLGHCTFLNEHPYAALDIFFTLIETAASDAYVGLGYIHMYLKNYRMAISYFMEVINRRSLVEQFPMQCNTLKDEFDLCLRLYCECIK